MEFRGFLNAPRPAADTLVGGDRRRNVTRFTTMRDQQAYAECWSLRESIL